LRVDEYFSRGDATGTAFFLADPLGSTVELADNAGGTPTAYTYEPFGATSATGSPTTSPYDFTGRESDSTGLKYYRARYYHPTRHRFISEDPIGFRSGHSNHYAYVGNRPTTLTDPLGLWYTSRHRTMTRLRAIACGFSATEADIIAAANAQQDSQSHVYSSGAPEHAMPGSEWMNYVVALMDQAGQEIDFIALGHALHAIQDAYSHDLRSPQGSLTWHSLGYLFGWTGLARNPDDPRQNPEEWKRAVAATDSLLREFQRQRLGARKPPPCAPVTGRE